MIPECSQSGAADVNGFYIVSYSAAVERHRSAARCVTCGANNTAENAVRAQRQEYAFDVGKAADEEEIPNFRLAREGGRTLMLHY